MDCERYERMLVDLLYGELDELGQAAAGRHTGQCARCRRLLAGLRATRSVGTVPILQVPEGLIQEAVQAERALGSQLPWRHRAGRWISILAGYAMRPQLGMAALAMLMVVTGLVLLRTRPGESLGASLAQHVVGEAFTEAGHAVVHAQTALAESAAHQAQLRAARAVLSAQGCERALPSLVRLAQTLPRGVEGQAALWETAQCQHQALDLEGAKHSLRQLVSHGPTGLHYDRARAMLDELTTLETPKNIPAKAMADSSRRALKRTARTKPLRLVPQRVEPAASALDLAPAANAAQPTLAWGPALPEAYRSDPGAGSEQLAPAAPEAPAPPSEDAEDDPSSEPVPPIAPPGSESQPAPTPEPDPGAEPAPPGEPGAQGHSPEQEAAPPARSPASPAP